MKTIYDSCISKMDEIESKKKKSVIVYQLKIWKSEITD